MNHGSETFIGNDNGRAESEGEGGQFHFAACLPFAPQKFQELANFQEMLIAFQRIREIRAKIREIFGEKHAI